MSTTAPSNAIFKFNVLTTENDVSWNDGTQLSTVEPQLTGKSFNLQIVDNAPSGILGDGTYTGLTMVGSTDRQFNRAVAEELANLIVLFLYDRNVFEVENPNRVGSMKLIINVDSSQ